ncbi:MAG: protein GrpE [Alphaproteobacteria bacterium]|nr:MAG: protein GrpE [Alphaproteobacteria bacterium]
MTETDGAPAASRSEVEPAATETEATTTATANTEAELAAARQEAAEFKDKVLRTLAEMENLRRRTEREVADARTYGISSFARDLLGVADNIRRALEAVGEDVRAGADAGVKALIEGVELTERDLLNTLAKNGIHRFEPTGEKFNPNFHQAMYEVPDENVPAGHVAQVMQAGYRIGERVLRPALVGVSRGAPRSAPQADAAPAGQRDPS